MFAGIALAIEASLVEHNFPWCLCYLWGSCVEYLMRKGSSEPVEGGRNTEPGKWFHSRDVKLKN